MKKVLGFSVAAITTIILSACSSQSTVDDYEAARQTQAQAEAQRQAQGENKKARQAAEAAAAAELEMITVTGARFANESVEPIAPDIDFRRYSPEQITQVFKKYRVNPTISTQADPISTFAMDVDSGSYHLAKSMLASDNLPYSEGIRIEEFINAFSYQHNQSDDTFALGAQVFPSPHREGFHVMHLSVHSKRLSDDERSNNNLVLVADTSGSMSGGKLELLKKAFISLVSQLDSKDSVALVSYSDEAKLVLKPTLVKNKRAIIRKIQALESEGSTNAEDGILLAYQTAEQMFLPGFNNRVVLTSDGMANVGTTDPQGILNKIESSKQKGIFLTTVGVGRNMYNDYLLEQLANKGNGHYLYFADENDIQSAFIDELYQQLETVAKDAKIQVKFNPDVISDYRLLGYENRDVADERFLDEATDGGEIGAGHQVNAIYEVKFKTAYSAQAPLAKVAIAYKKPLGNKVRFFERDIKSTVVAKNKANIASDTQLAFIASAFAEKLRQSYWAQTYDYLDLLKQVKALPARYQQMAQVQELQDMLYQAAKLDHRESLYSDTTVGFNFDRVPVIE